MRLILGSVIFLIIGVCFFRISNHAVLLGRPVDIFVRGGDRRGERSTEDLEDLKHLADRSFDQYYQPEQNYRDFLFYFFSVSKDSLSNVNKDRYYLLVLPIVLTYIANYQNKSDQKYPKQIT